MSESAQGPSPMNELCLHLAGLTQAVKSLQEGYTRLEDWIQELSTSASYGVSLPVARTIETLPTELKVPVPDRFAGDFKKKFWAFRRSCVLYFAFQPCTFSLEATKVGLFISLLQDDPQSWAHRLLEQKAPTASNLTAFFHAMVQLYEDPHQAASAEAAPYAL